jgi:hypothetical protein
LNIQTQTSPPGRFLVKLPASEAGSDNRQVYYEIDAIKASKKVSQRLREKKIAASAIKDSQNKKEEVGSSSKVATQSYPLLVATVNTQERITNPTVIDEEVEGEEVVMLASKKSTTSEMGCGFYYGPDCAEMPYMFSQGNLPPAAELIEDVFGGL